MLIIKVVFSFTYVHINGEVEFQYLNPIIIKIKKNSIGYEKFKIILSMEDK